MSDLSGSLARRQYPTQFSVADRQISRNLSRTEWFLLAISGLDLTRTRERSRGCYYQSDFSQSTESEKKIGYSFQTTIWNEDKAQDSKRRITNMYFYLQHSPTKPKIHCEHCEDFHSGQKAVSSVDILVFWAEFSPAIFIPRSFWRFCLWWVSALLLRYRKNM